MLVGIIDPSHYERAHDAPGRLPRWLTLDEAYVAASAPDPKWSPWTFELLHAALKEHQERGNRISTTTLVAACPRAAVIERKEDYVISLDSLYPALRGTMVHRTLEHSARTGAIAEARFYTTIDGVEISGSPDLVTSSTVFDYKVPSEPSGIPPFGYPFRHQTEQLMLNAFILRHAEKWDYDGDLPFDPREEHATTVAIVYLGPKYPKVIMYERKEEFLTPAGKTKTAKRPYVWSDEEVLDGYDQDMKKKGGMRARLHLMANALRDYPAWPEPWTNPETDETYTFESVFGGDEGWLCPGPPLCKLPDCLAARRPGMYAWEQE